MAHWFGVRPWELDMLTDLEVSVLMARLEQCPPVGGQLGYTMKD